jgi:hypothetical protein
VRAASGNVIPWAFPSSRLGFKVSEASGTAVFFAENPIFEVSGVGSLGRFKNGSSGPFSSGVGRIGHVEVGYRGKSRDGRLETRSAGRIVRLLGARIGIHLWPHALRHSSLTTAAAEAAKAGFSLNDVRVHSRHASVLTLQGYIDVHNAAKTRRAIADLVANALTSLNCDE